MIIVTGASGQLGREIVQQLLTRVPAEQIGVSVRDTEKAQDLVEQGVRVRQGDFDDAESLAYAFEGASQVLIISSNSNAETGGRQHRTALRTAKQAGASRILYTSHMGSSMTSLFSPMLAHAATEEALRDSGVAFTSLRNGFYASTVLFMLGNAIKTGELVAPEDGPVSWTTHADLAEVAAVALSKEVLDGVTPDLTASEALDLHDIAAMVSELIKRPVRRIVVPDADFKAGLIATGLPEARAELLVGMYRASRNGEFNRVDPTLARLIDRPTTPLQDVLKGAVSSST